MTTPQPAVTPKPDAPVLLRCKRCKHRWTPYVKSPKRCPKCISQYWNTPYVRATK